MEILTAKQIHEWDDYTIQHEPISSVDLMERAATACCDWLLNHLKNNSAVAIFCGKGNNGGDGLAIARILSLNSFHVTVYVLEFGHLGTEDFQTNLSRLYEMPVELKFISASENIPVIEPGTVIIDSLLGSGLNRPVEGLTAEIVQALNSSGNEIIAIDIPSGLSADNSSKGNTVVNATHTLSFQCYKIAFLLPENETSIGSLHILDIGLHPDYLKTIERKWNLLDYESVRSLYKPRKPFSHKGTYGHAMIVSGGYGKMGAAVLCAGACVHAGAGLLTVHIPRCGYSIMQTSVPEAMAQTDDDENILTGVKEIDHYDVIGIGPGIGIDDKTKSALESVLSSFKKPMVIDADALNILGVNSQLIKAISAFSILTPHPKEFERLFGKTDNDLDRINLAGKKAAELNCVILLKGRYSCVAVPDGRLYFNTSGNPGMATGGSGDALTGVLTALVAQKYSTQDAAKMGVFVHGRAGDLAAIANSQEYLTASELISHLGKAFLELYPDDEE